MSIPAGHWRIKTSSGQYLTLLTKGGTVTAMPANNSNNQIWEFQLRGFNYTIKNNGYTNVYAYSTGQEGAPVTGNSVPTEWTAIPTSGVYSIQHGNDTSKAYYVTPNGQVTLGPTQLTNPAQQFSIDTV